MAVSKDYRSKTRARELLSADAALFYVPHYSMAAAPEEGRLLRRSLPDNA
jgi:hypothetical protein